MEGSLLISYIASTRRRSESLVVLGTVEARGLDGLNKLTDGTRCIGGDGGAEANSGADRGGFGRLVGACSSSVGKALLDAI